MIACMPAAAAERTVVGILHRISLCRQYAQFPTGSLVNLRIRLAVLHHVAADDLIEHLFQAEMLHLFPNYHCPCGGGDAGFPAVGTECRQHFRTRISVPACRLPRSPSTLRTSPPCMCRRGNRLRISQKHLSGHVGIAAPDAGGRSPVFPEFRGVSPSVPSTEAPTLRVKQHAVHIKYHTLHVIPPFSPSVSWFSSLDISVRRQVTADFSMVMSSMVRSGMWI